MHGFKWIFSPSHRLPLSHRLYSWACWTLTNDFMNISHAISPTNLMPNILAGRERIEHSFKVLEAFVITIIPTTYFMSLRQDSNLWWIRFCRSSPSPAQPLRQFINIGSYSGVEPELKEPQSFVLTITLITPYYLYMYIKMFIISYICLSTRIWTLSMKFVVSYANQLHHRKLYI